MSLETDRIKNLRLVGAVPFGNLQVIFEVHRVNCHQVGCPILAALEERVLSIELGAPLPAGECTGMSSGLTELTGMSP